MMCIFANVDPQMQVDLVNAACGYDWTLDDMMKCGERGWNLKRAINNRMGLSARNDKLPKALLTPMPDGGSAGFVPGHRGDAHRVLRRPRLGRGDRQAVAGEVDRVGDGGCGAGFVGVAST
ncbi:MAG: aldehyde ferredoxin oxidoreductase C-terminal domain-containing protein [Candidatus Moduliflexus flocculans]|nr:aldehyde ferredoxin oxidoreductase C-terminal domain-containing protein [Candidatus Moduliflexus flocculans]